MGDAELAHTIGVSKAMVYNTRNCYLRLGVQETENRRARKDKGIAEKLDGRGAYHCPGLLSYTQRRTRWTLRMLADKLVKLELVGSISHEKVRQV